MKYRLPPTVLVLAPLLASGVLAQSSIKLKNLKEMRSLEDYEVMGSDRRFVFDLSPTEKDAKGLPRRKVAEYSEHKFLKATLEGKRVYLHRSWGEGALSKIGYYEVRSSLALYNEKMELIALRRMKQSKGKPEIQEFRWKEGQLHLKVGTRRARALDSVARPESLLGLMLLDDMKDKEKKTVRVLIGQTTKNIELTRVGLAHLPEDQGLAIEYSCTGAIVGDWFVSKEGKGFLRARLKQPAKNMDNTIRSREYCGRMLDPDWACYKRFMKEARKATRVRSRQWKNRFVGLSVRLPSKKWEWLENATANQILKSQTKDLFAHFEVFANLASYTTGVEGMMDYLATSLEKSMKKPEVSNLQRRAVKLKGRKAIRVDYDRKDPRGRDLHLTSYYLAGKNCVITIRLGIWTGSKQVHESDLESILKSIKFAR